MTQEEKQLLLIDLCGRLPYLENWVQYDGKDYVVTGYGHGRVSLLPSMFSSAIGPCPLIEEIKPYLRPMSDMTEEEKEELFIIRNEDFQLVRQWFKSESIKETGIPRPVTCGEVDFCNKNHFDCRGLIPMGLALEAPKDMYEKK